MINIKKALYHSFRHIYPADCMDYVWEQYDYVAVPKAKASILFDREGEYEESVEMILSHPVTLITSFFGLPNYCKRGELPSWSRIGWNLLGWEDEKELYINFPRAFIAPFFYLAFALLKLPLNVVKLATEFLPEFLAVVFDQATLAYDGTPLYWVFGLAWALMCTLAFVGRAITSPVENVHYCMVKQSNPAFAIISMLVTGLFYGLVPMLVLMNPALVSMILSFATQHGLTGLNVWIAKFLIDAAKDATFYVLIPTWGLIGVPLFELASLFADLIVWGLKLSWRAKFNVVDAKEDVVVQQPDQKQHPQQVERVEEQPVEGNRWKKMQPGKVSKTGSFAGREKKKLDKEPAGRIQLNL